MGLSLTVSALLSLLSIRGIALVTAGAVRLVQTGVGNVQRAVKKHQCWAKQLYMLSLDVSRPICCSKTGKKVS